MCYVITFRIHDHHRIILRSSRSLHDITFFAETVLYNTNYTQDTNDLQSSLDALVAWCDQWQLSISSKNRQYTVLLKLSLVVYFFETQCIYMYASNSVDKSWLPRLY